MSQHTLMDYDVLLGVSDLTISEFNEPERIVTIRWVEATVDGDRHVSKACANAAQFDAVISEYVAALNKAYRPEQ